MNYFLKQKGFTLIELIIVISVLAVLSVVGIAAFASYSRAQTLNAASGDLAVMLNLAKSRAYSQIKPQVAGCDTTPLDGYEVRICGSGVPQTSCITSGVNFELDVRCGGITRSPSISKANFSSSNLTFSSTSTPPKYSFFFPVLKGGVSTGGIIKITNSFTEFRTVTVDSSGNIRIN